MTELADPGLFLDQFGHPIQPGMVVAYAVKDSNKGHADLKIGVVKGFVERGGITHLDLDTTKWAYPAPTFEKALVRTRSVIRYYYSVVVLPHIAASQVFEVSE